MKSAQRVYNTRPLAKSEARYIGRQVPTESVKFPEIIHHPLKSLYSTERVQKAFPVNIFIYSSGLLIEEHGKINWFPIQNFYCSAAVVPEQDKHGLSFRDLSSFKKPKKHNRIIFAMVVRQPDNDEGRRVLMCHAFLVLADSTARQLIQATELAYQNKDGWNHPMNDRQFLNAKIDYTMDKIRTKDEDGIENLKDITLARDSRLAQLPRQQQPTHAKLQSRSSATTPTSTARASIQYQKGMSSNQVAVRGSIAPTRRKTYPTPNLRREMGPQGTQAVLQRSGKIPVTQAAAFYQGFNSDILTNGQGKPVRAWSMNGHQLNGTSSIHSSSMPINGFADYNYNGMKLGHRSRRQMSAPATPKSHRVLASSEPTELMNGHRRPSNVSVMDWDMMLDPSPLPSHENRRDKHVSKTSSDSAQLNGGLINRDHNGNQVQSSTSQSMVSESGYSITKVHPGSTNVAMGDDELETSFADQKL